MTRAKFWNRPGEPTVVAPSILSANFADLATDIRVVESVEVRGLHLDVMDGHFVNNITFGPPLVQAVRSVTDAFLDCHLMIEEPLRYAEPFAKAGADLISIHAELYDDPAGALAEIRTLGVRNGIAINPATPLDRVIHCLPDVDLLLVMSVVPGFGGQSFRPEALEKIEVANRVRAERGLTFAIEVDGGVSAANAGELAGLGADVLVAGSAVFRAPDPAAAVTAIRDASMVREGG
jgi:ribulose-phosphate 3-epimerase